MVSVSFLYDRMQEGVRGRRRRLRKDKLELNPDEMKMMLVRKKASVLRGMMVYLRH